MRTKDFFKNSTKVSTIFLFVATLTLVLFACDKDDDQDDSQVAPVEKPRNTAYDSFDDLAELLNTLAETDSTGQVTNHYYGVPLNVDEPTHLYIGVDKLQEAKDMFLLWLAPDVKVTENASGSTTAEFTDLQGRMQGIVTFTPGTGEDYVAEVTTNIPQQLFSQITFIDNSKWPSGTLHASNRHYKFDIVRNVKMKDLDKWAPNEDKALNFVCIQGSTNGVKPIFAAITNRKYGNPIYKQYIKMMRDSKYCPGTVTAPTAIAIQQILLKDWSSFTQAFKEAGNGPLIGGTEYWYDEEHMTFIWTYNGVIDYHGGYVYGEDENRDYYFLFRMYGLSDEQIYNGMSF